MLKPVSQAQREWLALFGETPQEHQEQVLRIQARKERGSTKDLLRQMNRSVLERLDSVAPIDKVVQEMKVPTFEWRPDAYILFIRKWTCACGAKGSCLDRPHLFLRQHKSRPINDPDHTYLYTPVKSIEFNTLPRLREVRLIHLFACELCLESIQCQNEVSLSVQVATESCGPSSHPSEPLSVVLFTSESPQPAPSDSTQEASGGYSSLPAVPAAGSSSESRSSDLSAAALDFLIPTVNPESA